MKGAYKLRQSQRITPAIQHMQLAAHTNGRSISSHPHQQIRWRYTTNPLPIGRTYDVLISYKLGGSPDVFVISPNLFDLTTLEIPHLYKSKKDSQFDTAACLCLYMTKYHEWTSIKLIAETIVPWIDLWLLYFEYWLATGDWEGGGEHPGRPHQQ